MSALRNPRFRRLLAGWTVSNVGDSALFLTLGIWAKDLTGSNGAAGLVFLALGLPVLAAPLLGHLVDRVRRRPLLVAVNGVAAVAVLSLLLVEDAGDLWLIYLVAAGYGAVGVLTGAAQSGLLKDLLPDDQLDTANATLSTIDQGLRLISPLIGAGLYTVWGGDALAVMASVTFLVAVVFLLTVRVQESAPEVTEERHFWADVTAGFRHVRSVPALWRIVVAMAVAMAVVGFYDPVIFAVIDQGLGREPEFFGVLMSVQGAGSIIGGLTAVLLLRRIGEVRAVGVSLACLSLSSTTLLSGSEAVVMAGLVLEGAAIPWFVVAMVTARQRATPPRLQGRAAAATRMAMQLPQMVSIALGSALVGVIDYRWLVVVGAVVLTGAAASLLINRPAVPEIAEDPEIPEKSQDAHGTSA